VFASIHAHKDTDPAALAELIDQLIPEVLYRTQQAAWDARTDYLQKYGAEYGMGNAARYDDEPTVAVPTPAHRAAAAQQQLPNFGGGAAPQQPPAAGGARYAEGQDLGLVHKKMAKKDMVNGMVWSIMVDEWRMGSNSRTNKPMVEFYDSKYHATWPILSVGPDSKAFNDVFQGSKPKADGQRYAFNPPLVIHMKAFESNGEIVAYMTGAERNTPKP
jgi:hypothetical protein